MWAAAGRLRCHQGRAVNVVGGKALNQVAELVPGRMHGIIILLSYDVIRFYDHIRASRANSQSSNSSNCYCCFRCCSPHCSRATNSDNSIDPQPPYFNNKQFSDQPVRLLPDLIKRAPRYHYIMMTLSCHTRCRVRSRVRSRAREFNKGLLGGGLGQWTGG